MFYKFDDDITTVDFNDIGANDLCTGYITITELRKIHSCFGISKAVIDMYDCKTEQGIDVYDDYTIARLKWDVIIILRRNLLIFVDASNDFNTMHNIFINALNKYCVPSISLDKIICAIFDYLTDCDRTTLHNIEKNITLLEELMLTNRVNNTFNLNLLNLKKQLLKMHIEYNQIIGIVEQISENENDIFDDNARYFNNLQNKLNRIMQDISSLQIEAAHQQDAYQAFLDLKLNHTMKVFTVLSSIFFPLTLIVGWYGMNFKYMPELSWRYGYIFVIALSLTILFILIIIVRRKHWL